MSQPHLHPRFLQLRHLCEGCSAPCPPLHVLCDDCEDARIETALTALMDALKETEQ